MPNKYDYKQISSRLTGGIPLSFKAYPDGSLVVIAHDGKKHRFTADQVQNAQPKPKPAPKTAPKPKRGRPAKAGTKIDKEN